MSEEQFEPFRGILGNDFRPIQELDHRIVRVTALSDNLSSKHSAP
jgi:hypothetical protein